jgi:MFS family permease
MALGPLVGGLSIGAFGVEKGIRLAFCVALAMALVAAVAQQRLIDADPEGGGPLTRSNPFRLWHRMSPPLRRLLVADILVRFCEQIPYAVVVIWCMQVVASPVTAFQFGILTTVEMATAVLVYIPVAWLADRTRKKPFVVTTFVFFAAFPLALLFCRSFWPLVLAFVLRGLKEFGEPTRKALILELAPERARAATFGFYYLLRDTVVSVAAFGGAFLWIVSPTVNLVTAFACGVVGTVAFALKGSDDFESEANGPPLS